MNTLVKSAIAAMFEALGENDPPDWAQLPDIGLYMDQVVTYLQRHLAALLGDEGGTVTPSMINNYAKAGVVPRTEGKKYSQEHMALLMAVFTLKRSLSMNDLGRLVKDFERGGGAEELYRLFRRRVGESAASIVRDAEAEASSAHVDPAAALRAAALNLAVDASLRSLAAEAMLDSLEREAERIPTAG